MKKLACNSNYKCFDCVLKSIQNWRKGFVCSPMLTEKNKAIAQLLKTTEKTILFIKNEYQNTIEPTYQKMNIDDYMFCNKNKLAEIWSNIDEEEICLNALSSLTVDLFNMFCKEYSEMGVIVSMDHPRRELAEEKCFMETPDFPAVLRANDFASMVTRLEWLVDHFSDNPYAKIFLLRRHEETEKVLLDSEVNLCFG